MEIGSELMQPVKSTTEATDNRRNVEKTDSMGGCFTNPLRTPGLTIYFLYSC